MLTIISSCISVILFPYSEVMGSCETERHTSHLHALHLCPKPACSHMATVVLLEVQLETLRTDFPALLICRIQLWAAASPMHQPVCRVITQAHL